MHFIENNHLKTFFDIIYTFFLSNLKPSCIQNHDIMNSGIKSFACNGTSEDKTVSYDHLYNFSTFLIHHPVTDIQIQEKTSNNKCFLTLLHSEWPKL